MWGMHGPTNAGRLSWESGRPVDVGGVGAAVERGRGVGRGGVGRRRAELLQLRFPLLEGLSLVH